MRNAKRNVDFLFTAPPTSLNSTVNMGVIIKSIIKKGRMVTEKKSMEIPLKPSVTFLRIEAVRAPLSKRMQSSSCGVGNRDRWEEIRTLP